MHRSVREFTSAVQTLSAVFEWRHLTLAVCLLAAGGVSEAAPKMTASPSSVSIKQVYLGPVAAPQKITFSSGWTASITTDSPWLTLSQVSGTQTTPLFLNLVEWRAASMGAGTYTANVTATGGTTVVNVPVTFQILPLRPEPLVSSIFAAPNNCTQDWGYIDQDLCNPAVDTFTPQKGVSFIDSTFGGSVRIMTDQNTYHAYSTPNPLSAHNKYLMILNSNGAFDIQRMTDSVVVGKSVWGNQGNFWDATDDETYYYMTGSRIMAHTVTNNTDTVYIDYGTSMTSLSRGGTGDSSADNWISFWSPTENKVCAVNLNSKETYCADYSTAPGLPIPKVDFTLISKGIDHTSGKRYVIVNGAPSNIVYSVNLTRRRLEFEYRGPELPEGYGNHDGVCDPGERCWYGSHTDTMQDSLGIQYMVFDDYTNDPCEFAINTVMLNKGADVWKQVEIGGGRKKVFTLWKCGPGWVDEHVACAKNAAACVISTQSETRSLTDTTPIVHTPHDNEIIYMIGNGDEIRRVTKSHTVKYIGDLGSYWSVPRAGISNDGTLVTFDSDYGSTNGPWVSIVSTTK